MNAINAACLFRSIAYFENSVLGCCGLCGCSTSAPEHIRKKVSEPSFALELPFVRLNLYHFDALAEFGADSQQTGNESH